MFLIFANQLGLSPLKKASPAKTLWTFITLIPARRRRRYIRHAETGETILLFVREAKEDKFGSLPFAYLGKVSYVGHVGNKPMSITWRLDHPIPARFLDVTDKLGVC